MSKGGGGNSHQRAIRKAESMGPQNPDVERVNFSVVPKENNTWQRLIDFFENPLVITAVGVLCGLVGTIIYTPVLTICGLCFLLGFHRAKVVADKQLWVKILSYFAVFVLSTSLLVYVKWQLRAAPAYVKERTFMKWELQQIGIDTSPDAGSDFGKLFVNAQCRNTGQQIARSVYCDASVFIHEDNRESLTPKVQEKYFEQFLDRNRKEKKFVVDRTLTPTDGKWFSPHGPQFTQELRSKLDNGDNLLVVVGRITYKDDAGEHYSDECSFMLPPVSDPRPVWAGCKVRMSSN
jgi:hypothetical protein